MCLILKVLLACPMIISKTKHFLQTNSMKWFSVFSIPLMTEEFIFNYRYLMSQKQQAYSYKLVQTF